MRTRSAGGIAIHPSRWWRLAVTLSAALAAVASAVTAQEADRPAQQSRQAEDQAQGQPQRQPQGQSQQPAQGPSAAVPASRQAARVVVLPIRSAIDRFTVRSMERRLARAADEGAQAVVIELDTPGGEVGAVLELSDLIKNAQTPNIVAWVNNQAFSGGAIVAMACPTIVTNDPATLGDALPIQIAPVVGLIQMQPEERQKILAPLLVDLIDSARRNGYDEKLVQGFVSLGVELWLIERTRPGPNGEPVGERLFIDLAEYRMLFGEPPAARTPQIPSAKVAQADGDAPPRPDPPRDRGGQGEADRGPDSGAQPPEGDDPTAFKPAAPGLAGLDDRGEVSMGLAVDSDRPVLSEADRDAWRVVAYVTDGKAPVTMTSAQLVRYGLATAVVRDDAQLKAFFGASDLDRYEEGPFIAVARFLGNPIVRGVLMVVVLVSFFVELASPGLGVGGAIGLGAVIALLAPPAMVGMAGWWEFAAIGVGAILVVVEIFLLPGVGIAGVSGAALLFVGLIGTFVGPGGFQTRGELLAGVVAVVMALATAGVIVFFLARNFSSIPLFKSLILAESVGEQSQGVLAAMDPQTHPGPRQGEVGRAVSALRPSGKARFGEQILDVVSVGPVIVTGQRVRVVRADGFSVVVEPDEEGA